VREDALITETRIAAQLPDNSIDYTAARIRTELNTQLQMRFARVMVKARVGMLLKSWTPSTVAGTSTYALPPRAMAAGFEALDVSDGTTRSGLTEVLPHQVYQYEGLATDRPQFFCVIGSSVRFYPTPNAAYTVRCQFYVRPSVLVEQQSLVSNVIGYVSSVDQALRQITLSANVSTVTDKVTGAGLSATYPIDVLRLDQAGPGTIEPSSSTYEITLLSATWTLGALNRIDVTAGFDMTEIKAGDVVRAFNQSEWPMIPHEYHPALAWAAAAKICRDRGMYSAAQALEADVRAALGDMADDIQPRVKSQSQALVPRAHMLRGRRF
jgi:hypothetical protein